MIHLAQPFFGLLRGLREYRDIVHTLAAARADIETVFGHGMSLIVIGHQTLSLKSPKARK
jgi:hypothetical protein